MAEGTACCESGAVGRDAALQSVSTAAQQAADGLLAGHHTRVTEWSSVRLQGGLVMRVGPVWPWKWPAVGCGERRREGVGGWREGCSGRAAGGIYFLLHFFSQDNPLGVTAVSVSN